MLGMKSYARDYIDACHRRVEEDVAAYAELVKTIEAQPVRSDVKAALDAFERRFFNDMVLVLDYFFVHRLAGTEGKDGNPLNEVRVLSNSMLQNNSILATQYAMAMAASQGDKSIKLSPEKSVLKRQPGDEVELTEDDFARLAEAYFAEIDRRFAPAHNPG